MIGTVIIAVLNACESWFAIGVLHQPLRRDEAS